MRKAQAKVEEITAALGDAKRSLAEATQRRESLEKAVCEVAHGLREKRISAVLDPSAEKDVKGLLAESKRMETELENLQIREEAFSRRVAQLGIDLEQAQHTLRLAQAKKIIDRIETLIPKYNALAEQLIALYQELSVGTHMIRELKHLWLLKERAPWMLQWPTPRKEGEPTGAAFVLKASFDRKKGNELERIIPYVIEPEQHKEIEERLLSETER